MHAGDLGYTLILPEGARSITGLKSVCAFCESMFMHYLHAIRQSKQRACACYQPYSSF